MKKRMAALMLTMAMAATPVSAYAADASQTLSVAVTAEVKTLVQWAASEEQASLVNNQAQEGLFRMDENNQPQPALCDTYDVSDDTLKRWYPVEQRRSGKSRGFRILMAEADECRSYKRLQFYYE